MNYYFVRDLTRPSLVKAVGLSMTASVVMATGLLFARSVFRLHVVVLVVLGSLAYAAVYWAGRSLWNRSRPPNS
jgi:hypothetical protein